MEIFRNQGPTITYELIAKFEADFRLKLPQSQIEFWFKYGNGGRPTGRCEVPIPVEYTDEEFSIIHGVYGIYHPIAFYSLQLGLEVIPENFQLAIFAHDEGTGTFGISNSPETLGQVFHYWADEVETMSREKLTWIAESPIALFEKYWKPES